MKFLFVFSILFSDLALANWAPCPEIDAKSIATVWLKKTSCESSGGVCMDITGQDVRRVMCGEVDDLDRVKYVKEDAEPCADQPSCQSALEALDCSGHGAGAYGVIGEGYVEVYCAVPDGYHKKPGLVPDPAGIAAADAEDAAKALKATEDASIAAVKKQMDCGKSVVAAFMLLNQSKGLTKAQKKTIRQTFKDAREFLLDGDIESAKSEVEEATPDGTLVTASDKTAMLSKIDECLAL